MKRSNESIQQSRRKSCYICKRIEADLPFAQINSVEIGNEEKAPLSKLLLPFLKSDADQAVILKNLICVECIVNFDVYHDLELRLNNVKEKICNDINKSKSDSENVEIKKETSTEGSRTRASKNFSCHDCNVTFKRERLLSMHIKEMHNGLDHKCLHCNETFLTASLLKDHIKFHNNIEPDKSSSIEAPVKQKPKAEKIKEVPKKRIRTSNKKENEEVDFIENLSEKESVADGSLPCHVCQERFEDIDKLRDHLQNHHTNLNVCWKCEVAFKLQRDLNSHNCHEPLITEVTIVSMNPDKEIDEIINILSEKAEKSKENGTATNSNENDSGGKDKDKMSDSEKVIDSHKGIDIDAVVNSDNVIDIDKILASEEFNIRSTPSVDKTIQPVPLQNYICYFCEKGFENRKRLCLHLYTHCNKKRYQCPRCEFSCCKKKNMRIHKKNKKHTGPIKMNKYKFAKLEKELFESFNLLIESRYSEAEAFYECRMCGNRSRNQNSLLKHMARKNHTTNEMIVHLKSDKFVPNLTKIRDVPIREFVAQLVADKKKKRYVDDDNAAVIAGVKYKCRDLAIKLWCRESGKMRYECQRCGLGFKSKLKALKHAVHEGHDQENIVQNLPVFDTMPSHYGHSYKARYRKNSLDYLKNPTTQNSRPCFGVKPELPLERLLFNNLKGTLKKPPPGTQVRPRIINMKRCVYSLNKNANKYQPPGVYYQRKRKIHIEIPSYEDEGEDAGFSLDKVKTEIDERNLGILLQGENVNGEQYVMLEGDIQVEDNCNLFMDNEGNIISQDDQGNCVKVMHAVVGEGATATVTNPLNTQGVI